MFPAVLVNDNSIIFISEVPLNDIILPVKGTEFFSHF